MTDWNKYAPYFSKKEFDCKHTGKNEMKESFLDILLAIRIEYGKAMKVTSGFRDVTHPVEAKKPHKNGEHTKGLCADIACSSSQDRFLLIKIALKHGITRIGFADSFLHLGVGDTTLPNNVFWDYSK